MQLDPNKITDSDRACMNCKFMIRRWTLPGIIDLIMSKFMLNLTATNHYHCNNVEPKKTFNQVTGVTVVKMVSEPCFWMRSGAGGSCGFNGRNWQPSERWLKDPKNLFKILKE